MSSQRLKASPSLDSKCKNLTARDAPGNKTFRRREDNVPKRFGFKGSPGVKVALNMSNTPLEILGCFFTDDLLVHSVKQTNLVTLLFCRLYSYRNVCASTGPAAGYTSCVKAYTGQNCDDIPSSSGASFEGDASSLFHMLQAHGRNAAGTAQREDKGWCRLYYNSKTGLLALQWKVRNIVIMLSTVHTAAMDGSWLPDCRRWWLDGELPPNKSLVQGVV